MQHRLLQMARFLVAAALAALLLAASAQNVGSLRSSSYDLFRTPLDRGVLTLVLGAIDAVQGPCSATLTSSLAAEGALAACATFRARCLAARR